MSVRRVAKSSLIARILVLSALLATTGCTTMVIDRYHDAAMTPSLYFRVDDLETPEVRLTWVHHIDSEEVEGQEGKLRTFTTDRLNLLIIRPELEACPFVEIFLNGEPLAEVGEWKQAYAIGNSEVMIPGPDDSACSLMLTFRTLGSPPTFTITAATKNGVVEEFPDGERQLAWLLLVPPTVVWDTVWITAVVAGIAYLADPGAFFALF